MKKHHAPLLRHPAEAGVTLIELMVALTLGLILIGGAIQVFVSNRAAYAFNEGFSRLQENGRFALDTINYHARLAGYLGCRSGVPIFNNLDDDPTNTVPFNLAEGVFGYEADGTLPDETFAAGATNPANSDTETNWDPALPAGSDLDGSVIPGSDVLLVRHVSTASYALLSPFSSATLVSVTDPAGAFQVGDIAVASDCQKVSIFQVTAIANVAGGVTLAHTATGTPGNAAATASWDTDQQYAAGAQVGRGETWAFYVGATDAGPPALFQRRLVIDPATTTASFDEAEELVEAVETMQVRYGVDANLDGAIEQYVPASAGLDWATVAAVRVAIVTRSPEEYGTEFDGSEYIVDDVTFNPVDDRRVRQVFVTTIAIRNRVP
jgi:type IV pilus assembly protein PilW